MERARGDWRRRERGRRRGWWRLAALLLVWPAAALAGQPLTIYEQRLERAEERLREMSRNDPATAEVMDGLRAIATELPAIEEVTTSSGTRRVDNRWLKAMLAEIVAGVDGDIEQRRSRLIEAADRIARLRRSLAEIRPARSKSPGEELRLMRSVLTRSEFQPRQAADSPLSRWLRDNLLRLLLVIGLLLAAGFGLHLITRRRRRQPQTEKLPTPREILGETLAEDTDARDLLSRARRTAELGDHRGAIRLAYIALLLDLAEKQILTLNNASTNQDYLREFRGNGREQSAFRWMTATFEEIWYGEKTATPEDFQGFLQAWTVAAS